MSCTSVNTVSEWYSNNYTPIVLAGIKIPIIRSSKNFILDQAINNSTDDQLSFQSVVNVLFHLIKYVPNTIGKILNILLFDKFAIVIYQVQKIMLIFLYLAILYVLDSIRLNIFKIQQCVFDLCVIVNITIEATNSSVGDITFNQRCPFCGGASNCRCVISDINIISND